MFKIVSLDTLVFTSMLGSLPDNNRLQRLVFAGVVVVVVSILPGHVVIKILKVICS